MQVRTHLILFSLTLILASCGGTKEVVIAPPAKVADFEKTINAEGLHTDLAIIASDSLQGRDTGSEGMNMAADYLARRYATLGITPVGDNGTYFQNFDLSQSVVDHITYTVKGVDGSELDKSTHSANSLANFSTLIGGNSPLSGEMVFIGYGIDNSESGVNQFAEDVAGKWLLTFYDRSITNYGTIQSHIGEGKALGAILIMGTDVDSFTEQATRLQDEFGEGSGLELAYMQEDGGFESAINRINPELAAKVLGLESVEALTELEEQIKNAPVGFEPYAIPVTLTHQPDAHKQTKRTKNVVAFVEGTDSLLRDEVIVVSAHFDHVGIGAPDSTGDTIYNGADDDGSGTVGIMHVAQALVSAKQAGAGLKRSVLFLHVTGEEKGLLGSRYYSDHPIFPIENTVANLNVDMIGRTDDAHPDDPNYIYVIGGKLISSGLNEALETANTQSVNIELSDRYNDLEDPNQFYRRSDHWNFGRLGVPFIFFFNGTHADYHRPSDEVDKIDFTALTKRTKLIFVTTALLGNSDSRPEVDNQTFINKTQE